MTRQLGFYEVTLLTLDLQGNIMGRESSTRMLAVNEIEAAELFMEKISSDGYEAATVEVNGRIFDCQEEVTKNYCAYERKLK